MSEPIVQSEKPVDLAPTTVGATEVGATAPVVEGSAIHEILARELFVSNHVHGKPGSRGEARGLWYDGLTGLGREAWRMEASWLIESLAESRISLTMGPK